jgi:hypothetical protein
MNVLLKMSNMKRGGDGALAPRNRPETAKKVFRREKI